MYIPNVGEDAVLHGATVGHSKGPDVSSWSSLIGIVTAICGNVLISFALNTQRYAHMRLGNDREQALEKSRTETKRKRGQTGSHHKGTPRRTDDESDQETIARERARKNAQSIPEEDLERSFVSEDGERQPLIPKVGSRRTSSSTTDTYVEDEQEQGSKSYLKSPIWWLGISMMVVGEAGNFLAYGFAPASIVSPLGVVALVSNCLIAPLLLKEKFRFRDGLGVVIAIGGCVTVVLSASGSNPKLDPSDIWKLITQWEFETYLGITVALIIALMLASNKYGHKSVLIDLGLVGLFGGYTALSTKGVASLLSNKIWKVFTFPITYLLVAILVVTAVMQIKYVNRALQRFNSTIVIPTQFVLFTISVIVGSAVLYRDFEKRSAADAGKFFGGCALTFLGVWCITSGRTNDDGDDQEDETEDETSVKADAVSLVDHEANGESNTQLRTPRPQRLHSTGDAAPHLLVTSPTATDEPAKELERALQAGNVPANRSAVHPDLSVESSSSSSTQKQPPPIHATTSEPVVPTLGATTPVLEPQVGSVGDHHRLSPAFVPRTPDRHATPHKLLSRQSIVDLLPGPLMAPLSSSLTAIVADSLRRGLEHTPASSVRARTLRLKRRRTGGDENSPAMDPRVKRHSIDSAGLDDLDTSEEASASRHGSVDARKGRMRSLSATLGDLFSSTPSRRRKSRDQGSSAR